MRREKKKKKGGTKTPRHYTKRRQRNRPEGRPLQRQRRQLWRGGFAFSRLVFAGDGAHGDGQAVPGVDGSDGVGQVDQFLFREFLAGGIVELIRRVILRNEGERFGPGEGGAFARSEE